jgi:hypothetical protein
MHFTQIEPYGKKSTPFGSKDRTQYIVVGITSLQPCLVESINYEFCIGLILIRDCVRIIL